jgi:hypothetical protein
LLLKSWSYNLILSLGKHKKTASDSLQRMFKEDDGAEDGTIYSKQPLTFGCSFQASLDGYGDKLDNLGR